MRPTPCALLAALLLLAGTALAKGGDDNKPDDNKNRGRPVRQLPAAAAGQPCRGSPAPRRWSSSSFPVRVDRPLTLMPHC